MPVLSRDLKVGLLLLVALGVFFSGLLVIGNESGMFVRKNRYFVRFQTVGGLAKGSSVSLDGVNVGTVDDVVLPREAKRAAIDVWIKIDRRYAERLRAPAGAAAASLNAPPPSPARAAPGNPPARPLPRSAPPPYTKARIKTVGLLGDKYLELNSGAEIYPVIDPETQIPSAGPTNVDALIASGEDVMDNVVEISHSLTRILGRVERGEGLLGALFSDSDASRQAQGSLLGTLQSFERTARQIETGNGPLPRLINDRRLADQLTRAVARFDALLAAAESGQGLLPAMLNDSSERARFDEILTNLEAAGRDLKKATAELDRGGPALVPRLLKDDAYGREITEGLRSTVERLDTLSERLVNGGGTVSRLINDPQIYEGINNLVVGVNKSWMLRWLIQNRQKAGIKQRYQDATRSAPPGASSAPPPKPPADSPPPPPPGPADSPPPNAEMP